MLSSHVLCDGVYEIEHGRGLFVRHKRPQFNWCASLAGGVLVHLVPELPHMAALLPYLVSISTARV